MPMKIPKDPLENRFEDYRDPQGDHPCDHIGNSWGKLRDPPKIPHGESSSDPTVYCPVEHP
jgi:hypothetical protein